MSVWPPSWKLLVLLVLALVTAVLATGRGPFSLRILRIYPKRLGSALAGWAARQPLPKALRPALIGGFAAQVGVNLEEAELPVLDYPTLQAFFTRRLKPGCDRRRPSNRGAANSPVDARIVACGRIQEDQAIQAKGLPYRITELLKHDAGARRFEGGHYLNSVPVAAGLPPHPRADRGPGHRGGPGRGGIVAGERRQHSPHHPPLRTEPPGHLGGHRQQTDEGLEVAAVLVGATHVGGVIIDGRWREGKALPGMAH